MLVKQRAAIAICSVRKGDLDESKVEQMISVCCLDEPHRSE